MYSNKESESWHLFFWSKIPVWLNDKHNMKKIIYEQAC